MDPRTRALLSQASTATITTQLFARGLRNTFLHGVKSLNGMRLIGPAFTLRYIPAREDVDTLDVYKDHEHPQRRAIEAPPRDVAGHRRCRPRPRHDDLLDSAPKHGRDACATNRHEDRS